MRESQPDLEDAARTPADRTPLPAVHAPGVDARFVHVWCAFLDQLATDAEAALAAAIAYRELGPAARDTWIDALDQDVDSIGVPRIAVYAPLLAVETDPDRRQRISQSIGPVGATSRIAPRGMCGQCSDGSSVAILVAPLYLDFVRVLACGYRPGVRFEWVRHDPIVEDKRAPRGSFEVFGTAVDPIPLKALVDDLALTVVAHGRGGDEVPEALTVFADLFGPAACDASWAEPG